MSSKRTTTDSVNGVTDFPSFWRKGGTIRGTGGTDPGKMSCGMFCLRSPCKGGIPPRAFSISQPLRHFTCHGGESLHPRFHRLPSKGNRGRGLFLGERQPFEKCERHARGVQVGFLSTPGILTPAPRGSCCVEPKPCVACNLPTFEVGVFIAVRDCIPMPHPLRLLCPMCSSFSIVMVSPAWGG